MHPNDTALNEYVDESLGPAERSQVEQHLATCATCRQTVEDLREILRTTGELELREPPVRAWSRLERAIKMERENATTVPLDRARGSRPVGAVNGPARAGRYAVWLAAADPRTAATLQKNLAVIDQAISESRAAVRAQPANEPAQQSLIEGFKTKIGLLQDTVALINEMRKGNEAGAARIASGLKQKGT